MAIGTPQARCRLITQSGRPSTIAPMRLRPFSGTKRVAAIAATAFCLSVSPPSIGLSTAMNHCGVQRKITFAFDRHECG